MHRHTYKGTEKQVIMPQCSDVEQLVDRLHVMRYFTRSWEMKQTKEMQSQSKWKSGDLVTVHHILDFRGRQVIKTFRDYPTTDNEKLKTRAVK